MAHPRRPRPRFNVQLLCDDMAARGWVARDLARAAGVADKSVSVFLSGQHQTARMAKKFADALDRPVRRYVIRQVAASAA